MFKSLNNRNSIPVEKYNHYHLSHTTEIQTALNVIDIIYLRAVLRTEPGLHALFHWAISSWLLLFETESYHIALASLELSTYTRQASNLW